MKLLKELCEASGAPGFEDRIRAIYRREMESLVDRIETDGLGNVIAIREGKGDAPRKVMIAGHLDEIGFVVKHIDDNGFLRLSPLGGFDAKTLIAKRVKIINERDEEIIGVIGSKPVHVMTDEEKKKLPTVDDLFVDCGMSGDRAKERIAVGDAVTLHQDFIQLGEHVCGKAMDNRVSLYVMIEALKRVKVAGSTLYAVATAQEEVGVRGAATAAHRIAPDVGIAIDVTLACDVPAAKPEEQITCIGKGVAIKVHDSYSISSPKLVRHCREIARVREIPSQMEILPRGGTDAGGIQRGGDAVPSITLSVPTRYVHTVVELVRASDLEATIALLTGFLETIHEVDLSC
ncbi:MAG: M42 family metallopeptidase [Planctomycetota bacterium]